MEIFRKLATENKKLVLLLAAFIIFGAVLLVLGRLSEEPAAQEAFLGIGENAEPESTSVYHSETSGTSEKFQDEQAIESRLAEFFSLVEGAGAVRVMVNPLGGRETVFATDTNVTRSHTNEQDAAGGTRETHHYQSHEQTVIINDPRGTDRPLVLREIEPRIEGIAIIAEGGACPFVRDALTRAARVVLGVEAHMVQVLEMKN